jgi:4-nitrophenyl phosphatase
MEAEGISVEQQAIILDMDGVLYRGRQTIPGVQQALARLQEERCTVLFATNNGWTAHEELLERIAALGVEVQPNQVVTAAIAAAELLKRRWPSVQHPFVLGSREVVRQLQERQFEPVDMREVEEADGLVVGLDLHLTYERLAYAQAVGLKDVPFVATDYDGAYPWEGRWLPGSGAIVCAVEMATGRRAVNAGKPSPFMYKLLLASLAADALPIVVGDNLETDIRAGRMAGYPTICVLSGLADRSKIEDASEAVRPDFVAEDLLDAVERIIPLLCRRGEVRSQDAI